MGKKTKLKHEKGGGEVAPVISKKKKKAKKLKLASKAAKKRGYVEPILDPEAAAAAAAAKKLRKQNKYNKKSLKAAQLSSNGSGGGAAVATAPKKFKKRKTEASNSLTEPAVAVAPATESPALDLAAVAGSKPRKAKKKAAALDGAGPAIGSVSPEAAVPVASAPESSEAAKPKKAKKKSAALDIAGPSNGTGEAEASAPIGEADEPSEAAKPKKAKKKAAALDGAGQGGSLMANVGNVELARSSRKLVKDLYTEHADVSQMAASELEKWQKERSISVVGQVMKPILTFPQSGEPPGLQLLLKFAIPVLL